MRDGEGEGERAEDEAAEDGAAEDEAAEDGGAAETGEEKKNELGIDALWVYVVFYKKSHGNLCAGFLVAVSWSFGWFSRFLVWMFEKRW
ncbi:MULTISPECIES: hypothetical protein [unclassified Clostridium]|uniref:hypothetical protein n=1 Tax=unclassified Clostridium TaxID=2614128 RepID=UPI0011063C8D|nr:MULTISPECIES: hypothetical protein [unclassified Clostridium]